MSRRSREQDLTIRKLRPEDARLARALVHQFHHSRVSEAYLRELLANPQNMLWTAQVGDDLVGFIWAHWLDRLRMERRQVFVYEIETASKHRRRGIGTALMERVLAEAAAASAEVFVMTNRSNAAAVGLYESLGGVVKGGDELLFEYPGPDPD